jgi:methylenetetrahydrofolate reductase (NADPH)
MQVKDILGNTRITFCFEFFPPKKEESWENLFRVISDLRRLSPSWVSVTYGAGGSTRSHTHDLVVRIQKETDLTVVSHLTCVGSSRDEIRQILDRYSQSGIENILALRGDHPEGMHEFIPVQNGFYFAADLVAFIKKYYPSICIGVAGFPEGHPATPNRLLEIEYLKAKVDAGADYIITQLFFDNRDFYDFCERCELANITVPIIAGIMAVTSRRSMYRMAEIASGARIPARLIKAINRAANDSFVAKVGTHWATEQVRDLLDNKVKGIHFYTLNHSKSSLEIYQSLGVEVSEQLRE